MRFLKLLFWMFAIVKTSYCYSQDTAFNGCHQLLVVTHSDWKEKKGNVQLYEKLNDDLVWIPLGVSVPLVWSSAGLDWGISLHPAANEPFPCKQEGNGKLPAGIFLLGTAGGFASKSEMSHLKMDYLQFNQHIQALDDSLSDCSHYTVDHRQVLPDWHSSEKMGEELFYKIGMIVDHDFLNSQRDAGSVIVLHIWRHENSGTAGWTATSQENLNHILSCLDGSQKSVLVQLPISQSNPFQNGWNLPILKEGPTQPSSGSLNTEFQSSISPITEEIYRQMAYSWQDNNPVPIENLRYVLVSHWGFDEQIHQGCLIVHEKVAQEVVEIFKDIFDERFPIEKMMFVDVYNGIDEKSAQDNNSYSFCSRPITGMPGSFSKHSYGLAIDINPLYNPYSRGSLIVPETGAPYLDRENQVKGMIHSGTSCYKAFVKRGWSWGGDWQSSKGYVDYHHFEKDPEEVLGDGNF